MKQIRIAWKICGSSGAGSWMDAGDEEITAANDLVDTLNIAYGGGTHWIESRNV